jgi:hypothetical protein
MAFLATREVTDVVRAKNGLLKPVNLELSDLAPPDTRMVKDAEEYAGATHTQDLLSHGYRTYYFGAMLAAYRKLKYDKEAHFAAALLHDIGLTESRIAPLKQCCFAVSGGRQALDFLLSKDHPAAKAQVVGDAISAHLNLHVPVRKYGEVASLVAKGAVCDLFGFEKRKLPERFKKDLLRTYPAGDGLALRRRARDCLSARDRQETLWGTARAHLDSRHQVECQLIPHATTVTTLTGRVACATKNSKGNKCQTGHRHNGTAITLAVIAKFGEAFEAGAAKPCRLLCRFLGRRDDDPSTCAGAGVREAPRHEIAVGDVPAVRRALWEFDR